MTSAESVDNGQVNSGSVNVGEGSGAANAFRDSLPKEYQTDPIFKNFNGIEDLLKSYKHTASMVGVDKNEIIRKPKEGAPQEEIEKYFVSLGRPSKVEEYPEVKIEGFELNKEVVDKFKEVAFKAGMTSDSYKQAMKWLGEHESEKQKKLITEFQQKIIDGNNKIKEGWGDAFEQNKVLAKKAISSYWPKEVVDKMESMGLASDPEFMSGLVKIGKTVGEDSAITSSGGVSGGDRFTPNEAKMRWQELQGDKDFMKKYYGGDPAAVTKVSNIFRNMHPEAA